MKYTHNIKQEALFQFGLMQIEIPCEHELVKLSHELEWESMVEIVAGKYSNRTGRNSKSIRMMIGLEIAKRKYGLTDEEIVSQLKVDVALKYFCGFNSFHHDIPDPSSLCKFRKRLDPETLFLLEEVNIKKFIRKAPKKRRHQVINDTTCVEANITYPTDSKLLTKVWEALVKKLKEIRATGVKIVIRGKLKVKQSVRSFNLKRKKSREDFLKMNERLISESRKLMNLIEKELRNIVDRKIKSSIKEIVGKAEKIIKQQQEMIKNKTRRVADRIVSFHETQIRPITRGKDGKKVEFGPKLAVNVIGGGLMQTAKLERNNYSDTEMVVAGIHTHRKTFGRDPTEFNTDRGGHSPRNHQLLEKNGIMDGIQYRGKIPQRANLPPPASRRRMKKQRSAVEGKIGTFKTKYGGDRNLYKDQNAQTWITFGLIAMNGDWAAARQPA